ncbi:MAG: hypothetical protein EZS28_002322 [Streblomastix strix]|uniref:Uncharacterized protein n=1 Tax=Streblomastix strix TaxID=222440 RepID=A0A5J4X4K4_9EUKA|nr:MAG: hypothetical protein EZS28_002322 [Streblomastix strix]
MTSTWSVGSMIDVRNQPTLFDKVVEAAFLFPAQSSRNAEDLHITSQSVVMEKYCKGAAVTIQFISVI